MHRRELKSLAAMNGHHTDSVDVGRLSRDRPVDAVLIEKLDAAYARKQPAAASVAGSIMLAADLQQLVDRDQLLARRRVGRRD